MRKTNTFKHNGYTLKQTLCNNHYIIYDSEGKMVMHCACTGRISEEQAKKHIDFYTQITSNGTLEKILGEEDEEDS